MSETAVNTFSVSKWLTTTSRKMSHSQQQVLKWSKNGWKSGTKCHMPSQHHLAVAPKTLHSQHYNGCGFFHSWSNSLLQIWMLAWIMFDQGILCVSVIAGCCVQRILAASTPWLRGKMHERSVVVFPIPRSPLQWTAPQLLRCLLRNVFQRFLVTTIH